MNAFFRFFYNLFHKKTEFYDLKHCKVPDEWIPIRNLAWFRASNTLRKMGIEIKTRCREIKIEEGIKVNPKTGQWGRPMILAGNKEFWYAGLGGGIIIKIVGTPQKHPYNRSEAIFTHEAAESIIDTDPIWKNKSHDERNKFLWSIGL